MGKAIRDCDRPGCDRRDALGAQRAAAVVKYDTKLTVTRDFAAFCHGSVQSDRDRSPVYDPARAVRKCMEGRRVILFKKRAGADRRLGTDRSHFRPDYGYGIWGLDLDHGANSRRVYGKVRRKVRDRFVCRRDRAAFPIASFF